MSEQKPKRCVIIGGTDINNYNFIRKNLNHNDFIIFCDSGLKHLNSLQLEPDLIVGDFDSHENPHLDVETIEFPREKDDTDTMFAVKEALRRGFEEFLLIGVVGARLDHTLGNVYILLYLDSVKKKGCIIDDYSEMEIVSDEPVYIGDNYSFFSLLNISGQAKGITIRDAKYPLENAEITSEYQYGISNEVLPGRKAMVTVKCGKLLLIKIY
jgi:thiamine pyrophosphokinase